MSFVDGSYMQDYDYEDPYVSDLDDIDDDLAEAVTRRSRRVATRPARRQPLRPVGTGDRGQGLDRATVGTPKGDISFQLPERTATQRDFEVVTDRLQEAIDQNRARLNSLTGDIARLDERTTVAIVRARREQKAAIEKIRKENQQSMLTSVVLNLMSTQQLQKQIAAKTPATGSGLTPAAGGLDLSALLPLFMFMNPEQDGGGSGDNNQMMMFMLLALAGK